MEKRTASIDVRKMTYVAILTALVVVLQFAGSFIRFGMFSITLVLVPIIVGAAIAGPLAGAWLGFVFAITVFITGDAAAFLVVNPFGTIVTVIVKGTLAGLVSGIVYSLLAKKNEYLAVYSAAIICPIVNTGVFLVGCVLFFLETLAEWGQGLGFESVGEYMILGLAGGNFLFELLFNIVLAPVIVTLIRLAPKLKRNKK